MWLAVWPGVATASIVQPAPAMTSPSASVRSGRNSVSLLASSRGASPILSGRGGGGAAAAGSGSAGSLAGLAPDDVFAARLAGLPAERERPGHGGTHPVRGRSRRSPTVRQGHHLLPIVRTLRNVGCVIELIE